MIDFEKTWEQCEIDEIITLNIKEFQYLMVRTNLIQSEEQMQLLFEGSDLDGKPDLSKEETRQLFNAIQSKNKIEINKIYFRAIDTDRNGLINMYEFPQLVRANNIYIKKHKLRALFKKLTKGSNYATFPQCLSFLLNKEVDEELSAYPEGFQVPPELERFNKIFDEVDTEHIDSLDYDQFKEFIFTYLERYDLTETEVGAWFNGLDFEHDGRVPKSYLLQLVELFRDHPRDSLVYLYFRGCDDNRDSLLTLPAYKDFLHLNKYELTTVEKMYLKSGKDDRVDFPTAYEKIIGKPPRQKDPYKNLARNREAYCQFNLLWEKLDKTKRGYLSFSEFKNFLLEFMDEYMTEEQMELWFRGSDSNNNGSIDKSELWHLTKAIWMNDLPVLNLIYFKGIDTDNNGKISAEELSTLYEINGIDKEDDEIHEMIEKEAPGEEELTFPQYAHLLFGMSLDEKYDIYEDRMGKNGFNGRFARMWKEFDADESNGLDFEEFKGFMSSISTTPMTEEQCCLYFKGLDFDKKGYVTKKQCRKLDNAIKFNNKLEINKILFRGVDEDNSNKIELHELQNLLRINGIPLSEEDARILIMRLSGGGTSISFAQFYSFMEGERITEEVEAYSDKELEEITKDSGKEKMFEEIWTYIDSEALGYLDYNGFKEFLVAFGFKETREIIYEYLFNGTDINNNKEISKSELRSLLKAVDRKDKSFFGKLLFRAADLNRDGLISLDEYIELMSVFGKKVSQEEATSDFEKVSATAEDKLNYRQVIKLLFDVEVDEDIDPYDGMLNMTLNEFNHLFNELDVNHTKRLEYDEFKEFLLQFVDPDMSELQCEIYFRGADVDNSKSVSWKELWRISKALRKNDLLFKNKLFFKGMDKKEEDLIDDKEFKTLADLNRVPMKSYESRDIIEDLTDGDNRITFTDAFNYFTKMEMGVDVNPYHEYENRGVKFVSREERLWRELCPRDLQMNREKLLWAVLELAPKRLTDERIDLWLIGLDSNNDGFLSREEFHILYEALVNNDIQEINKITYDALEKMDLEKEEKVGILYNLNDFCLKKEEVAIETKKIPDSFLFQEVYEHITKNRYKLQDRVEVIDTPCCACGLCQSPLSVLSEDYRPIEIRRSFIDQASPIQQKFRIAEIVFSLFGFVSLLLVFIAGMITYNKYKLVDVKIQRKINPNDYGSQQYQEQHKYLDIRQYGIGVLFISFVCCIFEFTNSMLLLFNEEGSLVYQIIGGSLFRGIAYIFVAVSFIGYNLLFSLIASVLTLITSVGLIVIGISKIIMSQHVGNE